MVDMTNDVIKFEELFSERFTENDEVFMKLKSKKLPNPVVIYPWRANRKTWNKRWDYGSRRNRDQKERGDYKNDNRQEGRQNSYNRNRDQDGENARDRNAQGSRHDNNRDRPQDSRRDSYRDRSQDSRRDSHRDRSQDGRRNYYRDRSQDSRQDNDREDPTKPFDYLAALKAYKER